MRRASRTAGCRRVGKAVISGTPASLQAFTIMRAPASVVASGFSQRMASPARAAARPDPAGGGGVRGEDGVSRGARVERGGAEAVRGARVRGGGKSERVL